MGSAYSGSQNIVQRGFGILLGVALPAIVCWALASFPVAPIALGILFLGYAVALYNWPHIWLIVIPAALPVFDLMPWSGRFYFTEFDFLILTTLAVLYARGQSRRILPGILPKPYRLPALVALSFVISMAIFLIPLPPVSEMSFTTYLTPYNAFRVAKGFFWAWLLLPFVMTEFRHDAAALRRNLVTGIVTGMGLAGIGVLWERGVFLDLVTATSIYGLVSNFLDFSGTYRVTGLFSGMHVGGEAIDGYLVLAAPFTLYPVLFATRPWLRILGLALFSLATYSVIVTFSRGLYAGYGLALLGIFLLVFYRHAGSLRRFAPLAFGALIGLVVFTALFFALYRHGGFMTLVYAIGSLSVATLSVLFVPERFRPGVYAALGLFAILAIHGCYGAIMTSKWSETGAGIALVLSVVAIALAMGAPLLFLRNPGVHINPVTAVSTLVLAALFWIGTIPPLSGPQVTNRFATVERDMDTRQDHWKRALAARDPSITTDLFGMGPGSFPELFFSYMVGTNFPLATYYPVREDNQSYLRLGGGDFVILQRIPIKPDTNYTLRARIRPEQERPTLNIKLCHKHLLYSERWTPDCRAVSWRTNQKSKTVRPDEVTMDGWLQFSATINSGPLGRAGMLYWPTTLMLHNGRGILHVTDVELLDESGNNLVKNSKFSDSMDHWFLVSDFEHLAWHSKNLLLHIFIEQGLFGVLTFALLMFAALYRLGRTALQGDPFAIILLPALIGFLLVGAIGTLIDMPRVAWLFYVLAFVAQATPRPKWAPVQVKRPQPDTPPDQ